MPSTTPGLGRRRSRRSARVSVAGRFRLRQLRQAEVEDLDAPVLRHEQVLGLQVPVDDPLLVRRREAARDLDRVVDRLARRRAAPPASALAQRLALEQLRDDVRRAVVRADVVDRRGCSGG